MSRFVQTHAGAIANFRPLLEAYVKGVVRGILPPRPMPERTPDVERRTGPVRVNAERVAAYLEITDGADLGFPGAHLLPPLYYTTWSLGPFLGVLSSGKLGITLLGMVHLENDLRVHRPLRPDDPITCRVSLESLERSERNLKLTVLCENRVGETLASESRTYILVRGGAKGGGPRPPRPAEVPEDLEPLREIRRFRLGADLGRRYGFLVGDVNPIHLSALTAKPFGFRRPIAHGFCLKALVAHALLREHGDRAGLERLNIRFRRAVPLPSELLCLTSGDRFVLASPDRTKVLADGSFSFVD